MKYNRWSNVCFDVKIKCSFSVSFKKFVKSRKAQEVRSNMKAMFAFCYIAVVYQKFFSQGEIVNHSVLYWNAEMWGFQKKKTWVIEKQLDSFSMTMCQRTHCYWLVIVLAKRNIAVLFQLSQSSDIIQVDFFFFIKLYSTWKS